MLVEDVFVAVAGLAAAHVEERRSARVDGPLRVAKFVSLPIPDPTVDPLAGFVIYCHNKVLGVRCSALGSGGRHSRPERPQRPGACTQQYSRGAAGGTMGGGCVPQSHSPYRTRP